MNTENQAKDFKNQLNTVK